MILIYMRNREMNRRPPTAARAMDAEPVNPDNPLFRDRTE